MNEIENLLRRTMGMHSATIGSSQVENAVRMRMHRLGLVNQDDYLRLVRQSSLEWAALVESVVITETWFFRDQNPFAAMVQLVIEEWLPMNPAGVLRLLSVPCSSGEEPYSLAMALMDAGVPAERFRIDAVDINERALRLAQRAVYGRNSFRGPDLGFRDRYFAPAPGGHALNAPVRRQVWYQTGNILDERCLKETGVYDFIFCRNLLIYFDRQAQDRTLTKLRRLLARTGVLFLGSAELSLALNSGFAQVKLPLSFACRKAEAGAKHLHARHRPHKPAARTRAPRHIVTNSVPPNGMSEPLPEAAPPAPSLQAARCLAGLEKARQLADEGRLAEAAEICETHLREEGVSAEAFHLLGLVRDAAGADVQAGEFYRKALYLDPGHTETLRHWALLAIKNGNLAQARILQERAERRKNAAAQKT